MIKSSSGNCLSYLDIITHFYGDVMRIWRLIEQNNGRSHVKSAGFLTLFEAEARSFPVEIVGKRTVLLAIRVVSVPIVRRLRVELIRFQAPVVVECDTSYSPSADVRHAKKQVVVPLAEGVDALVLAERFYVLLHIGWANEVEVACDVARKVQVVGAGCVETMVVGRGEIDPCVVE